MNIVVRNKFSYKLKNYASEIGYYSYTNRYLQAKKNPTLRINEIKENNRERKNREFSHWKI